MFCRWWLILFTTVIDFFSTRRCITSYSAHEREYSWKMIEFHHYFNSIYVLLVNLIKGSVKKHAHITYFILLWFFKIFLLLGSIDVLKKFFNFKFHISCWTHHITANLPVYAWSDSNFKLTSEVYFVNSATSLSVAFMHSKFENSKRFTHYLNLKVNTYLNVTFA